MESQDSIRTPIPLPDKGLRSKGSEGKTKVTAFQKTVEALVRIFSRRNIAIDYDAANLLVEEAWRDGEVDNRIIDEFYGLLEEHPTNHVSLSLTARLLGAAKAEVANIPVVKLASTRVLNVFHDIPRKIWDFQQQKLVHDHIRPTLLPETSDFQAAALQRYHRCVQRLKQCKKVRWWSENSVAPILAEARNTIRPVECAMGVTGVQSVVGVLHREIQLHQPAGSSEGEIRWFLADTLQKIELDFSECDLKHAGLFLNSNIVIVTGEIDQDSKLRIQDISHPPNDEDDEEDALLSSDLPTFKPTSSDVTSTPFRTELRHALLSCRMDGGSRPCEKWVVAGRCHFDDAKVHTNLFNIINSEQGISGLILTGEFMSQPYHDSSREQYKEGFKDFLETIKLCEDKLKGKRIVLVPGLLDPGPRFTPKLPLQSTMTPEFCVVVLASNPARFESQQTVPQLGDQTLTTRFTVCRQDLIYDIISLQLAVQSPYEIPEFPTRLELESTIPNLLAGQSHLYPLPFSDGDSLRIPVGYDFALFLTPLPDAVIISDDTVPYATMWREKCWFSSPGSVAMGHYLVYEGCSNTMEIKKCRQFTGKLENATLNHYTHSFYVVQDAMRLYREGKKSYFGQFLLNPSATYWDVYFVLVVFTVLCVSRFVLAGAHHPQARKSPNVFKMILGRFAKPKRAAKMCENLWYSCWHTFSFCFGFYVLYCEALEPEYPGWIRLLLSDFDVTWYWFPTVAETKLLGNNGWPLFPVSKVMRVYYLTELAFWLSCITFLWIETIRDDFHALLLHHIVTCVLIGFSYVCSFWRIGAVVLLTHDVADILLYSAKAVHYTKTSPLVVDVLFLIFVCGFFLSRLVFFPLFCLRPALETARLRDWTNGVVSSHWHIPGGATLPGFLCILQMLHIFWFGLIVKMIIATFRGSRASQAGDIRSDDENDPKEALEEQEPRPAGEDSGSESNASSTVGGDQRMHISSLPGVRATTDTRHRRGRLPSTSEATEKRRLLQQNSQAD